MEAVTATIYKSGKHSFLTEGECLAFERKIKNNEFAKEIITFLIAENFKASIDEHKIFYTKKDSYFTTYEFVFISGYVILNKFVDDFPKKPQETMKFHLCEIETFKLFFKNMIKFNQ
jgi:hypothetical protein